MFPLAVDTFHPLLRGLSCFDKITQQLFPVPDIILATECQSGGAKLMGEVNGGVENLLHVLTHVAGVLDK